MQSCLFSFFFWIFVWRSLLLVVVVGKMCVCAPVWLLKHEFKLLPHDKDTICVSRQIY